MNQDRARVNRADGGPFRRSPGCRTCGADLEPHDRYCPQCGTAQGSLRGRIRRKLRGIAQTGQDVLYGVLGWSLVLLSLPALAIALGAATDGALVVTAVALVWWLLLFGTGILVNPRFGRQLSRRHDRSTFGRVKTVDHGVVGRHEHAAEPCTVCGERFGVGVVRRRRDEFVLAGLPVYTFDVGYNHYCAGCEETGRFGRIDVRDAGESVTQDTTLDDRLDAALAADRRDGSGGSDSDVSAEGGSGANVERDRDADDRQREVEADDSA